MEMIDRMPFPRSASDRWASMREAMASGLPSPRQSTTSRLSQNSLPMRGGEGPFSYIDMGGMFTVLKVRDAPERADPGAWFQHPAGTVPTRADAARLREDGISLLDA